MRVTIRYRLDTEEFFTTDSTTLKDTTWEKVFEEVKGIESAYATVLTITREDDDDGSPL